MRGRQRNEGARPLRLRRVRPVPLPHGAGRQAFPSPPDLLAAPPEGRRPAGCAHASPPRAVRRGFLPLAQACRRPREDGGGLVPGAHACRRLRAAAARCCCLEAPLLLPPVCAAAAAAREKEGRGGVPPLRPTAVAAGAEEGRRLELEGEREAWSWGGGEKIRGGGRREMRGCGKEGRRRLTCGSDCG